MYPIIKRKALPYLNAANYGGGTKAINYALLDAVESGVFQVFIPPGVWEGERVNIPSSNIRLFGAGKETIIRKQVTDLDSENIRVVNASRVDNIIIENLTIDGNWRNHEGTAVSSDEGLELSHVKYSTMRNLYIYDTPSDAIDMDYCEDNLIENCVIEFCGKDGIHNSRDCKRNKMLYNTVIQSNQNQLARGSFTQAGDTGAKDNIYIGNVSINSGGRAFQILGGGGIVIGNKVINESNPSEYTGASILMKED